MKTWTNEQLIEAVKNSNKFIEVALKLGLTNLGKIYKRVKIRYITLFNKKRDHAKCAVKNKKYT